MANVSVKILDPADPDAGFLSVDEARILLNLGTLDAAATTSLTMQITMVSQTIMRICNRQFGRERVTETWRDVDGPQVYLTRWPVDEADVEMIEGGADYELEEASGRLWRAGAVGSLRVTYTGGYDLPDEAPQPLKYACQLLLVQHRASATREAISGIRMISHKESRVMFYDPTAQPKANTSAAGTLGTGIEAVDDLLIHYMRIQA